MQLMLFPKHENVSAASRFTSLGRYVLRCYVPAPLCRRSHMFVCIVMSTVTCLAENVKLPFQSDMVLLWSTSLVTPRI